jgi:hypothetical protein
VNYQPAADGGKAYGANAMANEKADGGRIKRITFAVPPEMIFATEALAAAEYCNVSAICRRALADALMSRGYLQAEEVA